MWAGMAPSWKANRSLVGHVKRDREHCHLWVNQKPISLELAEWNCISTACWRSWSFVHFNHTPRWYVLNALLWVNTSNFISKRRYSTQKGGTFEALPLSTPMYISSGYLMWKKSWNLLAWKAAIEVTSLWECRRLLSSPTKSVSSCFL